MRRDEQTGQVNNLQQNRFNNEKVGRIHIFSCRTKHELCNQFKSTQSKRFKTSSSIRMQLNRHNRVSTVYYRRNAHFTFIGISLVSIRTISTLSNIQ
jgi:hypothetical protein